MRIIELPPNLMPKIPDFWMVSFSYSPDQEPEFLVPLEHEAIEALGITAANELGESLPATYETKEDALAVARYIHDRRPQLTIFAVCSNDERAFLSA